MSVKRIVADFEVKLMSFGHIVHGNIEYFVPTVQRRMFYALRGEGEKETDDQGNVRFGAKLFQLCLEDISSVDLCVYKPKTEPNALIKEGEKTSYDLKGWSPVGLDPIERIKDKDLMCYFDFGQEVCLNFMLHMGKGFSPGKKYRMSSNN